MTGTLLISATFLSHLGHCISSFLTGLFNPGCELMFKVTLYGNWLGLFCKIQTKLIKFDLIAVVHLCEIYMKFILCTVVVDESEEWFTAMITFHFLCSSFSYHSFHAIICILSLGVPCASLAVKLTISFLRWAHGELELIIIHIVKVPALDYNMC